MTLLAVVKQVSDVCASDVSCVTMHGLDVYLTNDMPCVTSAWAGRVLNQ